VAAEYGLPGMAEDGPPEATAEQGAPGVTAADGPPRVAALRLHPLKSGAAVPVHEAYFDATGCRGDRRWLLVDAGGRFLTQREHPRMCLIRAEPLQGGLRLEAPGVAAADVAEPAGPGRLPVDIWGDRVAAAPSSAAADRWVSRFLGFPCRLVHFPVDGERLIGEPEAAPGDRVFFPDRYPILLLSEGSLDALNARLAEPLPVERFRPNLVVAGVAPHDEDGWARIRVGGAELDVVKGCARCAVTTVHPASGERGVEPLRTLATYRQWDGKVWFGQNAIPRVAGTVRVGDPVTVLARR